MSYKDTLNSYISKSKSRMNDNGDILQQLLMSSGSMGPATADAPSVVSAGGGSGGVSSPVGLSGKGHHNQAAGGKWGNPNDPNFTSEYLTTIRTPDGKKLQVNKNSAQAFQGFLNALYKQGYTPKTIGSYSKRKIEGTNIESEHSWGNAIDIDAQANRGDRLGGGGSRQGILPKNIQALAARFGLTWGGTWRSADPMHFEYTLR